MGGYGAGVVCVREWVGGGTGVVCVRGWVWRELWTWVGMGGGSCVRTWVGMAGVMGVRR